MFSYMYVCILCAEPYLLSEYGGDYHREAPVKLLEALLYSQKQALDQEVVVVNQV
jgi:PDZ domain